MSVTTPEACELPRLPSIEKWLKDFRVPWELKRIRLADIDLETSQRNQARVGQPILPEVVESYRLALTRGETFPAVVVYKKGNKYILIDGNQRTGAYEAKGLKTIDAYVVDVVLDTMIEALTFTANIRHGLATSKIARQFQAVKLRRSGRTTEWVAKQLGISENTVSAAWDLDRADQRATRVSFPTKRWMSLTDSIRIRLAAVRTDEGFTDLTKFVVAVAANTPEVNDLVTAINKDTSAKGQRDFVAKLPLNPMWAERHSLAMASPGRILPSGKAERPSRRSDYQRFIDHLALLERDMDTKEGIARAANIAGDNTLSERIEALIGELRQVSKAVKPRVRRAASA